MFIHRTEKAFQKRTKKNAQTFHINSLGVVNGFNLCPWNDLDDDGAEIVCYGCIFISGSSVGVHFRPVIYHQGYQVLIFDSSELFFAELTISCLTEREPTAVPNTRSVIFIFS